MPRLDFSLLRQESAEWFRFSDQREGSVHFELHLFQKSTAYLPEIWFIQVRDGEAIWEFWWYSGDTYSSEARASDNELE